MKFWCFDCKDPNPMRRFNTKGEALAHVKETGHKVLTNGWWSGWHFGMLLADGTVVPEP